MHAWSFYHLLIFFLISIFKQSSGVQSKYQTLWTQISVQSVLERLSADEELMAAGIIAVYVETIFIDSSDEMCNQSMSEFIGTLH